jgi:hypothetical protein
MNYYTLKLTDILILISGGLFAGFLISRLIHNAEKAAIGTIVRLLMAELVKIYTPRIEKIDGDIIQVSINKVLFIYDKGELKETKIIK